MTQCYEADTVITINLLLIFHLLHVCYLAAPPALWFYCSLQYLSGPLAQVFVFIVGVVGEDSACAQLDTSQELHASSKHCLFGCLCAVDREDETNQSPSETL